MLQVVALALALAASLPGVAGAQGITVIESADGFSGPQVHTVSGDGSVAGGLDVWAKGFLWSQGFVPIPALPPAGTATWIFDLSPDGSVAVGLADDGTLQQPIRWTAATGTVALGSLAPGQPGLANGVSADGSVIVGQSGNYAFRWTSSEGMQPLTGAHINTQARDVSDDGEVVVGSDFYLEGYAYRWTAATGPVALGAPPGDEGADAVAISADGSTIVGGSYNTSSGQAFRWTQASGPVGIGTLAGCDAFATAVSSDGNVIVGECRLTPSWDGTPFVWTPHTGMLPLEDFLAQRGIDFELASTSFSISVSDDGGVIGISEPSTTSVIRSYLIDITPAVPALPPLGALGLLVAMAGAGVAGLRASQRRR